MRHTQFFQVESVSKAILEVSREIFSTFCALFLLLNNTMYARIWSVFKVGEQVSIIFFDLQIFTKFSIFFPIVISINVYHVECGDSRQPRRGSGWG